MANKLTPKQAMFVIEYLKDLNGAAAAVRAGYSEESAKEIASENLTKPNVAEAIQEQMDARSERTLITADSVLAKINRIADRCLKEETFDAAGANKACETLAKHLKLITEKMELTGAHGKDLIPPTIVFEANKNV